MKSILILLHCESNTGYAIGPLESTFFAMALQLCEGNANRIHFAYPSMKNGHSATLPQGFSQYIIIDSKSTDRNHMRNAAEYISLNNIDTIFGFDQPVSRPIYSHFRKAGVKYFISYWGAPMSSLFGPLKLFLKRLEVSLHRAGPNHYIFESNGMAETAYLGRGIRKSITSVVNLGVDTDKYCPNQADSSYVYETLDIPKGRNIFFYAGHMEERKGVSVIMEAANIVASQRSLEDWQIVLFGNQPGEESRYERMLSQKAATFVRFGGYRNDLPKIQRGCYVAIIASTGWDSFPRSAIEMQASGLPLIASDLPGLREAVEPGQTGYLFPVGDAATLARLMQTALDDPDLRNRLSIQARARAEEKFSIDAQLGRLVDVVRDVTAATDKAE